MAIMAPKKAGPLRRSNARPPCQCFDLAMHRRNTAWVIALLDVGSHNTTGGELTFGHLAPPRVLPQPHSGHCFSRRALGALDSQEPADT